MNKEKKDVLKRVSIHIWIPLVLVLINFLFKGLFISNDSIAGDEPFSIYHAQMSVSAIIKQLSTGNNPPLYEILLHFWIKIFGISALSVRFPSLVFSCITLFFIYKLSIKNFNLRVAIYAAVFFIFSNYHTLLAHEARVYTLLGMLTALSMYYYLLLINTDTHQTKRQNITNFTLLILSDIVLIYAHYFGFFILIVQCLFIVFHKELLLKYWKFLLYAIFILAIAYLPNIIIIFNRFIDASVNGTWLKIPNGIKSIYNMLWKFSNKPIVTVFVISIVSVAAIKYFIIKKKVSTTSYSTNCIIFWFLFIFLFMFGISFLIPMFMDRYLMSAAIAFCILLAIAVDYLIKRKYVKYLLPGLLCILFIYTAKPNYSNKMHVKATIEKIKKLKTEKVAVFFCPTWFDMNFMYYYNINCFKDYNEIEIKKNIRRCLYNDNIFPSDHQNQIDFSSLNRFDTVIFLDAGANFSLPDNGILQKFKETFTLEHIYFSTETYTLYVFKINKLQ